MIKVGIDYIEFTIRRDNNTRPMNVLIDTCDYWFDIPGNRLYHHKVQSETGVVVAWDDRISQGTHYVLSGRTYTATVNRMAMAGRDETELWKMIISAGAKVTRLDLRADWQGADWLSIDAIESQCAIDWIGKGRTIAAKNGKGRTDYYGSPRSDKQIRIYDKKHERGGDGDEWTRLEVQLRRKYANKYFTKLYEGRNMAGLIGSLAQCHLLPTASVVVYEKITKVDKDENTKKWLLRQCAPALARIAKESPEFRGRFDLLVDNLINE